MLSLLWIASIPVWANASDCPDLSSLQPSTPESNKSGAQNEADRLVAEARASLAKGTTAETLAHAISHYEQALRIDPRNAPAHLFLASAHMSSQRYLSVPKKLAHERAFEHLAKGREIDPANVVGLYTLADEVFLRTLDYGCVRQILDTALRLEPDNPATHVRYSELLSGIGEFDLAFEHADRALAMSEGIQRRGILLNLGRPRYMAGQYDWVLDHYAAFLKEHPGTSLAHFYRSLAFGAKGQVEEALVEAKLAQPDAPAGDAGGIAMLALAYAHVGQPDEARQLLGELLGRHARTENVVEYRIAAVYEALGERDKAFEWLEREIGDRSGVGAWLLWLKQDPAWKAMRQDPRFRDILRRSGW
jgi:tetratricopeptide (TPR) repeat protein